MASEKITNILEEIKSLTILELSDLVKAVEEEFGVSAAAPVGVLQQQAQQLPQLRRRPSSTLSSQASAQRSWTSSRQSVRSRVWV